MDGVPLNPAGEQSRAVVAQGMAASGRLRETAVALEAQFLSQMLKHAGFDGSGSALSGGTGEDQFASFLRDAQARRIAEAGGIGLAESIYRALEARA